MLVRFWGTRGSRPCPGEATLRYGGNTPCVEIRTAKNTIVVLDCGSGASGLGNALAAEFGDAPINGNLLISHTHWDHIQGLPFFSPLFSHDNDWSIYGPRGAGQSLEAILSGQMEYEYFPICISQLAARKEFIELTEGVFNVGEVRVTTRFVNHPVLTLGYRLEADDTSIVYVPDHEPHYRALGLGIEDLKGEDLRHSQFIRDADLLIHDAQFTAAEYPDRAGWGHSSVEYVVDLAVRSNVKRLALFHHDPERNDDGIDRLVELARDRVASQYPATPLEVFAATELECLEVTSSSTPAIVPTGVDAIQDALVPRAVLVASADTEIQQGLRVASADVGCDYYGVSNYKDMLETARQLKPSVVLIHTAMTEVCDQLDHLRSLATNMAIVLVKDRENAIWCANDVQGTVSDWISWPCSRAYLRARLAAWSARSRSRWPAPNPQSQLTLSRLDQSDPDNDERFQRITRLASRMLDMPLAAISLVDEDRLWIKSIQGAELSEAAQDSAYCSHTIKTGDLFQVKDTMNDERIDEPTETDSLVNDLRIRFYAGVPLRWDSHGIGTLCVMDTKPRELSPGQIRRLKDLATLATEQLILNRSARGFPIGPQMYGDLPYSFADAKTAKDAV